MIAKAKLLRRKSKDLNFLKNKYDSFITNNFRNITQTREDKETLEDMEIKNSTKFESEKRLANVDSQEDILLE